MLFDIGNGRNGHITWEVADRALQQDFLPDSISSDLNGAGLTDQVFNFPNVLSKFLMLGMSLEQVIARGTINSARSIPTLKDLGTLRTGAIADIACLSWPRETSSLSTTSTQTNGSTKGVRESGVRSRKAVAGPGLTCGSATQTQFGLRTSREAATKWRRRARLLPWFLFVTTICLLGQNPAVTFRVDVPLVSVDVAVLDPGGRPLTSLTQEDFLILEDGQPHISRTFPPSKLHTTSLRCSTHRQHTLSLAFPVQISERVPGKSSTEGSCRSSRVRRRNQHHSALDGTHRTFERLSGAVGTTLRSNQFLRSPG